MGVISRDFDNPNRKPITGIKSTRKTKSRHMDARTPNLGAIKPKRFVN
jgi:hypothetical protein